MQQIIKRTITFIVLLTISVYVLAQQTFTVHLRNIPESMGLYCNAVVCGVHLDKCLVDTGASCVILTYNDYLTFKQQGLIGSHNYVGETNILLADKKKSQTRKYKMKSVQIGNVLVPEVVIAFATSPNGIKTRMIGLELFQRFNTMSIDLKAKNLYLTL